MGRASGEVCEARLGADGELYRRGRRKRIDLPDPATQAPVVPCRVFLEEMISGLGQQLRPDFVQLYGHAVLIDFDRRREGGSQWCASEPTRVNQREIGLFASEGEAIQAAREAIAMAPHGGEIWHWTDGAFLRRRELLPRVNKRRFNWTLRAENRNVIVVNDLGSSQFRVGRLPRTAAQTVAPALRQGRQFDVVGGYDLEEGLFVDLWPQQSAHSS